MRNMSDIRCHLLTGAGRGGKAMRAVAPSRDPKDAERSGFWLEEIIPGAFRLRSGEDVPGKALEDARICCPNCGGSLKAISGQRDGKVHAFYVCPKCRD